MFSSLRKPFLTPFQRTALALALLAVSAASPGFLGLLGGGGGKGGGGGRGKGPLESNRKFDRGSRFISMHVTGRVIYLRLEIKVIILLITITKKSLLVLLL